MHSNGSLLDIAWFTFCFILSSTFLWCFSWLVFSRRQ
jgi:hypothetical protein